MLRPFDLAARSLLIVGGLNWLSIAASKVDFVAATARARFGRPNIATRTLYGLVGGAALWSLARLIEQEAFPKKPRSARGSVRGAMTDNPTTVTPTTPVVEAARLLASEDVGSLPVVDGGRLVGVVTDRDLALRVLAEDKSPAEVTVGEIASHELVTVEPGEDLDRALHLMAKRQLRRLPVVEHGRLVGVLAQRDLALISDDSRAGELVERISE